MLRPPVNVTESRLRTLVEAILQSNTEVNVARLLEPLDEPLEQPRMFVSGRRRYTNKADTTVLLNFLSSSARIAEGSYCLYPVP